MAALLFHAVSEALALTFAEWFYREHEGIFRDSLEDHKAESRHVLEGCALSYPAELNERERQVYASLDEDTQTAFRICRSLANLEGQQGVFAMASGHMADRLDSFPATGERALGKLLAVGAVEVAQRGVKRQKGQQGVATRYRWLL
jgi:hypothetical protein